MTTDRIEVESASLARDSAERLSQAVAQYLAQSFSTIEAGVRLHAGLRGSHPAVVLEDEVLTYASLDAAADCFAECLRARGMRPGEVMAICAGTSVPYIVAYLGALRAGIAVAPLMPGAAPEAIVAMLVNAEARLVLLDEAMLAAIGLCLPGAIRSATLDAWVQVHGEPKTTVNVAVAPDSPCNLIYSSGTTGTPKGIVQSHAMRWAHVQQAHANGYGPEAVTLASTPLYSNTTLVSVLPTLALGGTVVLMRKFDSGRYLELAARHGATHTMLVPVQYQRLLDHPAFHSTDLSSFRTKFCTSAPLPASAKADIVRRWPGLLIEYYGMTEGGGACVLIANQFPDKLHTVGRPAPGHDIRLIDDDGHELTAPGAVGEVVGHSPQMMTGYHRLPEQTADVIWNDPTGKRFIRTGDLGSFDADGFLVLRDRKKDLVISGGFNVYPSDLEAVMRAHPEVADCAVIGLPSQRWGETPVASVVLKPDSVSDPEALLAWANARLGKTQRLAAIRVVESLPRSAIGKVLKRELRAQGWSDWRDTEPQS